mmetsp:Transcript_14595/g.43751  ORF Transcript_14595/g.43751 Transcript_14595/m.43751 type:complete len:263 (+) Transcript_14595:2038-2826(+)
MSASMISCFITSREGLKVAKRETLSRTSMVGDFDCFAMAASSVHSALGDDEAPLRLSSTIQLEDMKEESMMAIMFSMTRSFMKLFISLALWAFIFFSVASSRAGFFPLGDFTPTCCCADSSAEALTPSKAGSWMSRSVISCVMCRMPKSIFTCMSGVSRFQRFLDMASLICDVGTESSFGTSMTCFAFPAPPNWNEEYATLDRFLYWGAANIAVICSSTCFLSARSCSHSSRTLRTGSSQLIAATTSATLSSCLRSLLDRTS